MSLRFFSSIPENGHKQTAIQNKRRRKTRRIRNIAAASACSKKGRETVNLPEQRITGLPKFLILSQGNFHVEGFVICGLRSCETLYYKPRNI